MRQGRGLRVWVLLLALGAAPRAAVAGAVAAPGLAALMDPAPVAAWNPALQGFSRWAQQEEGLRLLDGEREWGRLASLSGPESRPEALAALAPLVQALDARLQESPHLRWQLENVQTLPRKEQKRVVQAVLEAREEAASRLKEALKDFNREPAAGSSSEIAELDSFRQRLEAVAHLGLYGGARTLSKALDTLRDRLSDLRTAWVTLNFGRDAEGGETPLERFLLEFHRDLILTRPDLYRLKLEKAAESDFWFHRVFPQLQYRHLADLPEAAQLRRAPEVVLDGDGHPDNVQIVPLVEKASLLAPQYNDFDDSDLGPSSLDLARMLAGVALLGDGTEENVAHLVGLALQSYLKGLDMGFMDWVRSVSKEKAVSSAKPRDRDWINHAGVAIKDQDLVQDLLRLAPIASSEWRFWSAFDRRGAGGSSIGVLRDMLASGKKKLRHAYEFKQLRAPAPTYFTGVQSHLTHRERVDRAYAIWRSETPERNRRTLAWGENDWLLRRRERFETPLSLKDPESVARVMGGLLAQGHARQSVDLGQLRAAAEAFPARVVSAWVRELRALRAELKELLKRAP